ncbi:Hydroxysteroid dehydrogenase-like protein 2 [Zancudomyces culisetae]|uniref:Hydroxysteroid dehydrogenase-like protein 2 n=1 Tax=Zancudomyces culisetae TaxID=1213189 RepID=A0A1R1PKA0_ZANCU|nr:Hydroxysteroid dehydrogenase-like protein 2 [Zancudomyces culisetae]OMH82998.1 Hydroxysteroid dehydrogenase-like protein 2 [Zancudomyces culisetae]|eukprot:OMH81401.1 Hydroxysteroid dehydrogenase-like protein 2 [Zancudomyces culisetae]
MVRSLKGKVLFITGCSRGIGEAIAIRAAKDGAKIAVVAKTTEAHPKLPGTIYTVAEKIREAGGEALPIKCDLRDEKQVRAAIEKTVEVFGGIDIVINNGQLPHLVLLCHDHDIFISSLFPLPSSAISLTSTEETSVSRYDLMHSINARGTWLVSKLAIPYLKKAENPHILTMSSPLSMDKKWFGGSTAYTMAKYGMSMTVLGLSAELKKYGIAVNSLWPYTAIGTSALTILDSGTLTENSRNVDIMSDAAYIVLTKNSKVCSGNFFIDEILLRDHGVTDFEKYNTTPGTKLEELSPDFFIDDESEARIKKLRMLQSRL